MTLSHHVSRAAFPLFVGRASEAWCHECRSGLVSSTPSGRLMTCRCARLVVELPLPTSSSSTTSVFWTSDVPRTAVYLLIRTHTAGWSPFRYCPDLGVSEMVPVARTRAGWSDPNGPGWSDPNGPVFPVSEATGWLSVHSVIDS